MIELFQSSTAVLIILLSDQRVAKKMNRRKKGLTTTPKRFDHHPNQCYVSWPDNKWYVHSYILDRISVCQCLDDPLDEKPNMICFLLWYPHTHTHTSPIASIITVIVIDSVAHNWVQSSRNEIHSCQFSAICKYIYKNSDPSFISLIFLAILPNALFPHIIYQIFLPHIASHCWCEPACRYDARPYWISHAMVQLRAEGAIGENPINHRRGPLARPKWPSQVAKNLVDYV